jgi:hypothetical protein
MALKLTREGLKKVVTGSTANGDANVDTALFDSWFALFTAWPGWDPGLELDDLTLATFGGYAGKAATWSTTYVGQDGRPSSISNLVNWQPANADTPNAVIGVALLTANDTGDLLGVDMFAAPVPMTDAESRLNYALEYGLDPNWTYGEGTVVS